jgi:hypothetical protein
MHKLLKYCFIASLVVTNFSSTLAKDEEAKPTTLPSFGAGKDSKELTSKRNESPIPYDNQDPACTFTTFSFLGNSIRMFTYSTAGYGPCDIKQFAKLNVPSIAASIATTPNKPYFILKSGALRSTATTRSVGLSLPYVNIGGLKFSITAETILPLSTLITSPKLLREGFTATPYLPYPSIEKSYYYWEPNTKLYELVDPVGNVYIMTAFSDLYTKDITEAKLANLDDVLTIPRGWKYRTRTIDRTLQVRTKQITGFTTIRVTDELGNLYIQEKDD